MPLEIRIAVRDWDYLTPLALGDITSSKLRVVVDRVDNLVPDVGTDPLYGAAEVSFSRYASRMAAGDETIVGAPNFLMRGFRHRCIITTQGSPLSEIHQLSGKRIGVPGWRDSGHTWTRAALRREGVGVDDAFWVAGRLESSDPVSDKLAGFGRPGRIEAPEAGHSLMDLMMAGKLDAVLSPFTPSELYSADSPIRPLLPDARLVELAYFRAVGYVPGIHLLAYKASLVAEHPWVVQELGELLDESQRIWLEKRRKYADTTPWLDGALVRDALDLSKTWNSSGFESNEPMIADFATELHAQGILPKQLSSAELFPAMTAQR